MAIATGKKMRRESGLNRHELHRFHHARKRPGKEFNNNKREFWKHRGHA